MPEDTSSAIEAVSLSVAAGDEFDPSSADTVFASGVRGVAAWYRYAGAGPGTRIELRWTYQGQPIFNQREELRDSSGTSTWVLRMERESPLVDGAYALQMLEDGRPVIRVPFRVGTARPAGTAALPKADPEAAAAGGGEPTVDTAAAAGPGNASAGRDTAVAAQPGTEGSDGPRVAGDEPGESVRGLTYHNESAGFSFSAPSYAWRFDLRSRREAENAVAVGRFSPEGSGLAILRVRVFPDAGPLEPWAAERRRAAEREREILKTERRELAGRAFVQVEARQGAARILTAYTVQSGKGYVFEFRSSEESFAALADEFEQMLASARFR